MTTTPDRRPATEFAPSETRTTSQLLIRVIGLIGLACAALGTTAVIANQFKPVMVSEGWGYLLAAVGAAGLFVHAARETDAEYRRAYGLLAVGLLVAAVVLMLVPGKPKNAPDSLAAQVGYFLLPWGVGLGVLALLFLIVFTRNETDPFFRMIGETTMLAAGGIGCVTAAVLAIGWPTAGIVPALLVGGLGVAYLCGYFGSADTSAGLGWWAAVLLGVLGAAVAVYALGRAVLPPMLYDGPRVLHKPDGGWSLWPVLGRAVLVLLALAVAAWGYLWKSANVWVRVALGGVGMAFAAAFLTATFAAPVSIQPPPYLVPGGLVTFALGLAMLGAALAVGSEAPVVVLARRELASYFYSPIIYMALFAMAVVAFFGQGYFLVGIVEQGSVPEPVLAGHFGLIWGMSLTIPFVVPALTMRALSEERRTGTLEVLLTAPVKEWEVVVGKFVPTVFVYLLCWLPSLLGIYGLQAGNGGTPFDYRPLLSYLLAVFACGLNFVGIGLFASSLSRNQIVAALLTFAAMFVQLMLLLVYVFNKPFAFLDAPGSTAASDAAIAVLSKFSYKDLWMHALSGQLETTAVVIQASLAALWLFLTVKVLEARKWG